MAYPRPSRNARPLTAYEIQEAKFLLDTRHRYLKYSAIQDGGWQKVASDYIRYASILLLPMVAIWFLMVIAFDSETLVHLGVPVVTATLLVASLAIAWFAVARMHLKFLGWLATGLPLAATIALTLWTAART